LSEGLKGIVLLHEMGIVHGDIKECNILVTNEGGKLFDFEGALSVGTATTRLITERYYEFEYHPRINKQVNKNQDLFSFGLALYQVYWMSLFTLGDGFMLPSDANPLHSFGLEKKGDLLVYIQRQYCESWEDKFRDPDLLLSILQSRFPDLLESKRNSKLESLILNLCSADRESRLTAEETLLELNEILEEL